MPDEESGVLQRLAVEKIKRSLLAVGQPFMLELNGEISPSARSAADSILLAVRREIGLAVFWEVDRIVSYELHRSQKDVFLDQ